MITLSCTVGGSLPVDASSTDFVVSISKSSDFPGDKFFEKLSRVLKPGGEIVIHQTSADAKETTKSSLVRKVLVAGFSDIEVVQVAKLQSFGSKAKKRIWKLGSSFSLKKTVKSLPKVLIDDEMDLIDEDSLLSEEDFKKPPQLSRSTMLMSFEHSLHYRMAMTMIEVTESLEIRTMMQPQVMKQVSLCVQFWVRDSFVDGPVRFGACFVT